MVSLLAGVLPGDDTRDTAILRALWEVSSVTGYLEAGGGLPGAAAMSWGICRAGMMLLPAVPTFLTERDIVSVTSDPIPGVCLLLMAVILLLDRRNVVD